MDMMGGTGQRYTKFESFSILKTRKTVVDTNRSRPSRMCNTVDRLTSNKEEMQWSTYYRLIWTIYWFNGWFMTMIDVLVYSIRDKIYEFVEGAQKAVAIGHWPLAVLVNTHTQQSTMWWTLRGESKKLIVRSIPYWQKPPSNKLQSTVQGRRSCQRLVRSAAHEQVLALLFLAP